MEQNTDKSVQQLANRPKWRKTGNYIIVLLIVLVCAVVFIVHRPALSAEAICYDDELYFIDNFLVRNPSWESVERFFTEIFRPSIVTGYYQPLTMTSLMLDCALRGKSDNLLQFHLTSLILHTVNTALIIVLLYQLFGQPWIAAGVGLLFGVHPLTVEPIPWISERKTLLAAFFALWSLVLYVRFAQKNSRKAYAGCVITYILALLSKPTSTPLPVMMLLMDFWPLGRLKWRSITEKIPLFVIGAVSAAITFISQRETASVITPLNYGLLRVPFVICHNIIFYLYKMVLPVNLAPHYAFPEPFVLSNPAFLIGITGSCLLIALLIISLRRTRAVMTGWLIFFVAIFPTMQVFQFSDAIASDKFVYLPSIGILMIIAAFLCRLISANNRKIKYAIMFIILALAGAEASATRHYLGYWKDTVSLFTHMTKVMPNSSVPLNNLGTALAKKGDMDGAKECYIKMLKINPNDMDAHFCLGYILAEQGKYDEAMYYYKKVISSKTAESKIYRNMEMIYNNLAVIMEKQGNVEGAMNMYRNGIKAARYPAILHIGLGTLLLQQGKIDEGIAELETAVKLQPNVATFNNLGKAMLLKGNTDKALEYFRDALLLDPKNADAHCMIGNILAQQGKIQDAVSEYQQTLQINPQHPGALQGLKNLESGQSSRPAK